MTAIVPCRNYARFLPDCLRSLQAAAVPRIVVIDDASDDDPGKVCSEFGVEYVRVDFRDLHKVRAAGMALVETKYVAFIDADNMVRPDYFRKAIEAMERHRNVAFVYPVLMAFDEATGPWHGTDAAPQMVRAADVEDRNWCDGNSVWRSEPLMQSLVFRMSIDTRAVTHDWRMAREVLRGGNWLGLRSQVPLDYRVHAKQMTAGWNSPTYFVDANLENERVSIVIAFSGRWRCWERQRQWLERQTYRKCRLVIMNGSHRDLSANDLDLGDWNRGLTIDRFDAGKPKLANEDRTVGDRIRKQVEAAVAGIYNRAALLSAPDEYLFFLEDDVVPRSADAIGELMQQFGPETFAVSGLYKHRYHNKSVAFRTPISMDNMLPLRGPEFEQVDGTGFGCLLARRSVLCSFALSGDDEINPHYDCDLAARLKRSKWKWYLSRRVECDHLVGVD